MTKVVVIGGGYGGLRAIEGLVKNEEIEITLVDLNPYHYLQTEAYAYIASKSDVHNIVIDLESWCAGFSRVSFVQMEVTSIDFERKYICSSDAEIRYDYVILAVGARTNFFSFIDGLREHSHGVKFLHKAYNFRKDFESLLHKKLHAKRDEKREFFNIAIGGAGLSGVEVAAEMAFVLKEYEKTIGKRKEDINIYLIDASETILPGSSRYIIKNTTKRLEKLGVKILTSAFISRVDANRISFKEGDDLEYAFMIFTGGIKAAPLCEAVDVEKNRLGQLIVDKYLNIAGYEDAFGVGDCVELRDKKGKMLPPTAQIAERSAEYVAKAILAKLHKRSIQEFDASVMGVFVALGGKYAVGEMFGLIKVSGYKSYLLKKAITHAYHLGLKLRINAGFKIRNTNENVALSD